ncbi:MAG: leucyl/phenylalanyl-tRNA--protein transferase [Bacteriovoracaceae bacterium]|nr:leucyl/phenylalanyl-tRNA--protein transferase [Bacteriovoracaceae bacterium]
MSVEFPAVDLANEDGLLAIGGGLTVETLEEAYTRGIFPWPISKDFPLTWFAPNPRGIIKLNNFHTPRSLKKFLNKSPFEMKFNTNFKMVIHNCAAQKRKHEEGTWINPDIIRGYQELFENKKAYCVEAYQDNKLVGGLYGVCIGEIISGESMFHTSTNASKACLAYLVHTLKKANLEFLDTQMVTPVVESLGGEEIPREEFMQMLERLDNKRSREDIFGS